MTTYSKCLALEAAVYGQSSAAANNRAALSRISLAQSESLSRVPTNARYGIFSK